MNELAIRTEEQILSLFPKVETEVYQGWVLKTWGKHLIVFPLYGNSDSNIIQCIRSCEEIGRQRALECMFRIAEHTNYHLRSRLEDEGYKQYESNMISECEPRDSNIAVKKGEREILFLQNKMDGQPTENLMADNRTVIGIKRQEFLYLCNARLPVGVMWEDVIRFSLRNKITKILANIPNQENIPESYEQLGFHKVYLYQCYQKERLQNGFAE